MTIQGMDICLNVTAGPAVATRKNTLSRTQSSETSIKRLKNQSFRKDAAHGNKESQRNASTRGTGCTKRIKQRSLSAIFAKRFREARSVVPDVQPSQGKGVAARAAASGKVAQSDTTDKRHVESNKISSCHPDSTNESAVSFVKATKEHVGKVLFAKKRDDSNRESKKSLSQIFSSQLNSQNESVILNLTRKDDKSNSKSDEEFRIADKSPVLKSSQIPPAENFVSTNKTVSFGKSAKGHVGKVLKRKSNSKGELKRSLSNIFSSKLKSLNKESDTLNSTRKHDIPADSFESSEKGQVATEESHVLKKAKGTDILSKRKERIVGSNRESDKTQKLTHRPGGKVSSLFGNNPDVPTIGQRFVRPVSEPVFTEITFADLNVHPFMISNLEQNMSITKMTTVQQKAIPQIFSDKNVLIRSQTGSGKTLAYALPIVELLHKIRPKLNRNSGLLALVVVPTRELALQTYECFVKLVKPFTWIVPGYIFGGEKRKAEKARLRKGCNILISTPGRLLDHIKHTKALRLNNVKYFVLDEADRMLDMGYEMDISGIVGALKISRSNSESGYDAMKIFKEGSKKTVTDKEMEGISKEHNTKSKTGEDNTGSSKTRQMYHSSDDSDSDDGDRIASTDPVSEKTKEDERHSAMNRESCSKVESVENVERDCEKQSSRRTILLSATLTQAVEKLAGLTMRNPIFVDAAKENLAASGGDTSEINEDLVVPQSVMQSYIVTPAKLRMVTLSAYIAGRCQTPGQHKILIFMATQDMVDYYTEILSSILTKPADDDDEDSDPLVDVEFFKLHGNMTQKERTGVFKTFSQAKSGVLLCTDVAARGLDMPKVDCVVQYTGPISARDYVHRIGRTARAGCSGVAAIFLTPAEVEFVRMLESRRIRIRQQDMNDVLDKLLGPFSRHGSVHAAAVALQNDFEELVLENRQLRAKACKAYVSWVRFYSSYPRDMHEVFNRKDLHLGHYAKSFALRDPPQQIGRFGKKLREEEITRPRHNNRLSNMPSDGVPQKKQRTRDGNGQKTGSLKRVRMLNTSEYDSGLEPLKKPKK